MNPCPQCGATLRWIPEANYWNCDRCGNRLAPSAAPPTPQPGTYQQGGPQQQGYPPQQQGYPPQQQGYPPQGYGHYPQHGPPKGKGKLIAIIVVGLALAAGGIVLAVVLSKKGSDGGGGGGGFDSGEALAKATLEAMAAGDADKVVGFMPTLAMAGDSLDCPAEAKAAFEEETKKGFAELEKKLRAAAGQMKGSAAVYKSGALVGSGQKSKPGDAVGPCKAKVEVLVTGFSFDFDYTDPKDKSKQSAKAVYGVMVVGGKYYLTDAGDVPASLRGEAPVEPIPPTPAPPAPAGDPAALQTEMEALKTASCACTDKSCADAQWSKLMAFVDTNKATLEAPGAEAVNALGSESVKCLDKLRSQQAPTPPTEPTPPSTPTEPTPPATPGKGLPECEAYAKAAERFIKCGKVPKQSRDAVQTAVDTMRKNWGDTSTMSEDMRKSAAETCVTLEKSMKDAAKAIGCK